MSIMATQNESLGTTSSSGIRYATRLSSRPSIAHWPTYKSKRATSIM